MSDPSDRNDDEVLESPLPENPESVDPGEAEDIDDDVEATDDVEVDPIFDDDAEVIKDNLGYEE
jgi:hypothetical protein